MKLALLIAEIKISITRGKFQHDENYWQHKIQAPKFPGGENLSPLGRKLAAAKFPLGKITGDEVFRREIT